MMGALRSNKKRQVLPCAALLQSKSQLMRLVHGCMLTELILWTLTQGWMVIMAASHSQAASCRWSGQKHNKPLGSANAQTLPSLFSHCLCCASAAAEAASTRPDATGRPPSAPLDKGA